MKKIVSQFFITASLFFWSCTVAFRQQFADDIIWIPKHEYTLLPEKGVSPVLAEKVPVILSIKFDDAWNNDRSNKPKSPHRYEKWNVNPEVIQFRIKGIRVEGGEGKLFKRVEIDGNASIGEPFKVGSIVQHGDTPLYYVPNEQDTCHMHKVSIDAVILTCDFNREGGDPITCSLRLDEPLYALKAGTNVKVAYVEDKGGTPIHINITSDNVLASLQKYRLVKWCVTDGQGTMYVDTGSCKKTICSNEPIKFGNNTLFYAPKPGSDGNHTIHLTVGNTKSDTTQDYSFSVKVQDHRIENFTAELSMASEKSPLLPFKDRVCKLKICPLTDAGKVLNYHIKAIKLNGGKFILGKDEMIANTPLTVGVNTLMFNPCGFVGDLEPSITIINEKGDEREVTFKQPFVVKDPDFKVVASLEGSIENGMDNRHINLKVIAPFNTISDKFILSNYRLSGGIVGDLLKLTGEPVEPGGMLSVGDSAFKFRLGELDTFMDKIDGAPRIYFDVTYPDGTNHETEAIDLSIFLFEGLASKIEALSEDSKSLYKPIVQDYSLNPELAFQNLQAIEPAWYNRQSNLHNILVYMQHDTAISTQATDALTSLQTLKSDTKDKVKARVLTTRLLHDWNKEIGHIRSNQEPDGRRIHTGILEKEVSAFSDIFRSCRDIPCMEDIVQSLDDVLEKIEDLKRETEVKQANKDRDKAREEAFKDRTTRSIENEQRERKYEDQRLEMEIEELCESRNKLESKIRKHDGDISDLNALIQELSRVNSSLKDQINKNELSRQYENRLLEASIHANCANSRRERMFVLDMVEKIINEHK
ncbi:hypothetical protein [Cardinium endosymbiont of Dermatophagoides farinae]|uniref:hypothetical protein n=1 Tax=Cardinium endosymbiont of Dermatophagoides farinae TaxID=2597823 RepID=UPI0011820476|nr:hypothetical protein [Cardinium endosymbiont of Dermatophagoides farinae]TSJ79771.1 hypothetical protein FPG78_06885 [Cardinium endosymbiont of Dermatophagoides farinae]TSJ79787.1 hypothetical protein FPG78_06980 [Cardinium endosymbiont of Dermatophagoides farinae]